jgi:hypothetical protein
MGGADAHWFLPLDATGLVGTATAAADKGTTTNTGVVIAAKAIPDLILS